MGWLIVKGGLSWTRGLLVQDIVTANEMGVVSLGHMLMMLMMSVKVKVIRLRNRGPWKSETLLHQAREFVYAKFLDSGPEAKEN